jgi:DNA-binding CsgD family transcriptional regulator
MTDDDRPLPHPAHAYTHVTAHGVLTLVQRRLNSAQTVGQLLAWVCDEAPRFCGFSRALVLGVEDGRLSATGVGTVDDPASDALRRRVLAAPIPIVAGTEEAELLRGADGRRDERPLGMSVVREQLDLRDAAMAVVAPEGRPVALLVLDRPGAPVDERDRAAVDLFAHLVGMAIERVVLRRRMHELSTEFRHLTASAHALINEALDAPVGLQADFGHGPIFPTAGQFAGTGEELRALLSEREREVAALMVSGRSNREIGDALHLSADTVKASVGRLVRKLGASNRVEAVARYVMMSRSGHS